MYVCMYVYIYIYIQKIGAGSRGLGAAWGFEPLASKPGNLSNT